MLPTVAFGPVTRELSWKWVGEEVAQELSKHYRIRYFERGESIPRCSVAVMVRNYSRGSCPAKIFVPIDHYKSENQLILESSATQESDIILLHTASLQPFFAKHCRNTRIEIVDHHNRYSLGAMAPYKRDGFILFVGHPKNLPDFFKKAQQYWFGRHLLILSESVEAVTSASKAFPGTLFEAQKWTEDSQKVAMVRASAALDLKGDTFDQVHKPPTKAQKYIMSGIPFATNPGNYVCEYFEDKGFKLATPDDPERWFSESYWRETHDFGERLRQDLTLENVALKYKTAIDSLLFR